MGLLAHVAAGALQGVGTGITNTAIAKRNEALEAMRQRYETNRDTVEHERRLEVEDVKFRNQAGLLAIGGQVQAERDERKHGYSMEEIGAKQVNAREMAVLDSQLREGRTEAEIRLRDGLESGEIKSVVKGGDGQYYAVTETGLSPTGVSTPTETTSGKGLTEGEIESLYQDERRAWIRGGKKGPEPTRTELIKRHRGIGTPPETKADSGAPSMRAVALSQLGTVYANATPERYPGLFRGGKKISLQEARRQIEQRYPE